MYIYIYIYTHVIISIISSRIIITHDNNHSQPGTSSVGARAAAGPLSHGCREGASPSAECIILHYIILHYIRYYIIV